MPTAAPHPCIPGCPELVAAGRARCQKHSRQREQLRGSPTERGYDGHWRRFRRWYLARNPICVLCRDIGMLDQETGDPVLDARGAPVPGPVPASVVDHVRDHKGDQRLFWDEANLRAVCAPHHDRRVDAGDFGRA